MAEKQDSKQVQIEAERVQLATAELSRAGFRSMPQLSKFADRILASFRDYVIDRQIERLGQWEL